MSPRRQALRAKHFVLYTIANFVLLSLSFFLSMFYLGLFKYWNCIVLVLLDCCRAFLENIDHDVSCEAWCGSEPFSLLSPMACSKLESLKTITSHFLFLKNVCICFTTRSVALSCFIVSCQIIKQAFALHI